MKIMIFNTLYYPNIVGGAEKSVQLLSENLIEKGYTPIVVSTAKKDAIKNVNGVKVYYLNHRNLYWGKESNNKSKILKPLWHALDIYNPLMKKKFDEIIKEENPDIIHTNNLAGFSVVPWISAKEFKIPVIHTLRDYYLMCLKSTMFNKGENCKNRCKICSLYTEYKRMLTNNGYVQNVVGISNFIINKHKEQDYFKNVDSVRIFNGIELNESKKYVTKIEKKRLNFFYMGRIEAAKGVNLLLKVFNEIDNADLYLAGNIYDITIKEGIKYNHYSDNIHFMGFIDPKDAIPNMDVVIVPSLWDEPFGRVVIEAYKYQKPVIATNRGGLPELIKDGKTGYLYDANNEESLKKIIINLINFPEKIDYLITNIDGYLENFNINLLVNQYIKLYEGTKRK